MGGTDGQEHHDASDDGHGPEHHRAVDVLMGRATHPKGRAMTRLSVVIA